MRKSIDAILFFGVQSSIVLIVNCAHMHCDVDLRSRRMWAASYRLTRLIMNEDSHVPRGPDTGRERVLTQRRGNGDDGAGGGCARARASMLLRPLHDTVLKRYRVAAGSARPLRDYHLMHDSSFIHDYRLPRDPSYSTILPSFTTTSALAIPLWISLPGRTAIMKLFVEYDDECCVCVWGNSAGQ